MDPLRRPGSAGSTTTTTRTSSYQARTRSPLSISSSIDPDTGRLSEDSSSTSSSLNSYNGKPDLAPTRMPPKSHWQQKAPENIAPIRYGAGGAGRQQVTAQQRNGKQTPAWAMPPKRPVIPGEAFRKLPQEVLLVILAELRKLHVGKGTLSCSTCWMREAINLGLCSKKWWGAARVALYEDIQLNGADSLLHTKKKYKVKHGTRLKLLRRTLRADPATAELVKSLKVPSMPETAKTKEDQEQYMELVASVVMACPNLEKLPGFYPGYAHEYSKLVHALSSRSRLKEMVWVINPSRFQRQHRYKVSDDMMVPVRLETLEPGPLLPHQSVDFMYTHANWSQLRTLTMHCNNGGMVDSLLFQDIIYGLPQLENLHVSNFPATAFNDLNLQSLPPLRSVRLENLPGVTDDGLAAFASPVQRHTLRNVSLIHCSLTSISTLSRIFSSFRVLQRFILLQAPAPVLAPGEVIFLHPYIASMTLEYLHWEFTNPDNDRATGILSKAIAFQGFPALKTIRSPTDFEGLLQMHCRPREKIELASDRYRNMGIGTPNNLPRPGLPASQSTVSLPSESRGTFSNLPSPTTSTFSLGHSARNSVSSTFRKSPTNSTFSMPDYFSNTSLATTQSISLVTARRLAQQRSDAATSSPKFHILIWDENGHFHERFEVGGYLGNVASPIYYSLRPDVDGSDEAVVRFGELLNGGEETNGKEGCTGSWCLDVDLRKKGKVVQRKKEDWWHTERGRWKEVALERFF